MRGGREGGREGGRNDLLTRENGTLHGRTVGDCLVGVDALIELFAVEEVGEELLDLSEGEREGGREGGRRCVK